MENLRERLHVFCSWQSRERPEGSSFGYSLVRILCGKISVFEREFLGVILGEDPVGELVVSERFLWERRLWRAQVNSLNLWK
ncbi:hypothetical protein COLO4_21243 [Corchorus olitorius]|uniref:Uncharacterized protein n=1 Tax=Corchorus olitorius TaxID=93759 RepID=A0A1R3IUQ8_9ROSI|nr:hypothetical protein COLO4_21243 [Corchorus olitorius]